MGIWQKVNLLSRVTNLLVTDLSPSPAQHRRALSGGCAPYQLPDSTRIVRLEIRKIPEVAR